MYALTVNQLKNNLDRIIDRGYGNHRIYIASDEEGNSFNPLFYACQTDKDEIKATSEISFINFIHDDNVDNIVLLG